MLLPYLERKEQKNSQKLLKNIQEILRFGLPLQMLEGQYQWCLACIASTTAAGWMSIAAATLTTTVAVLSGCLRRAPKARSPQKNKASSLLILDFILLCLSQTSQFKNK